MSVAAMTMDDQRPLMNSYEKMSKQYEQSLHVASHSTGTNSSAAPPSGPASPTPSGSEEPPQHQFHHSHHHHHHTHHHHQQQQQQQQYHPHHNHHQTTIAEQQQHQSEHQHHEQQQQVEQQHILQESSVVAEAVAAAEQRQRLLEDEIESLKVEQTRLTQQCADAQRREKILMRRLANKEQEFQDYVTQIAEYKAAQAPSALALRSALLDPAVNLLFEKLKKELKATKAKLEETQNELSAWKFTPDSNTGKRLMAKCRLLYQENEELGKMTSNGRLAKLETELAMQKSFSEEVKKSQSELDDFLQELDEDVEGMQSTIIFLQQELKTTRERIQILEKENYQLKNGIKDNEVIDATIANTNINTTTSSPHNGDGHLIINEINTTPYQIPAAATLNTTNNEYKYHHQYQKQPILETINENECLHTATAHTEYYNGIVEEPLQRLTTGVTTIPIIPNMQTLPNPTPLLIANEDCGSSNSSNTSNNQLRTVAARKRNYDESSGASPDYTMAQTLPNNLPTAMQQQQVSSPRTLPPKKSKLRITTSRSSDQLNELVNDMVVTTPSNPYNSPNTPINLMDNVVVTGLSSDEVIRENNNSNTLIENVNDANVPQRIMTRRRSLRMQQNGNGDNSNH